MHSARWIIIDTETDGLQAPIHVVELAGQMMDGWQPVGTPFRMLLNHDVPISPRVVAVHGYTREYLRAHGHPPAEVYAAFRQFAEGLPIVSHNLSYDWDRCLVPEWRRLGVPTIGRRGFCCLMMARRLALEIGSHRLDDLKAGFGLTASRAHRALHDVMTLVELFEKVYQPRLDCGGIGELPGGRGFCAPHAGRRLYGTHSRNVEPAVRALRAPLGLPILVHGDNDHGLSAAT